jgi:putative CocE/NonD family hydrolase
MERIPIRFVVRIAESKIGGPRVVDQRQVDHLAGIASIQRTGGHRFAGGEDRGVNPYSERQGKHGDSGKLGIAAEHAGHLRPAQIGALLKSRRSRTPFITLVMYLYRVIFPLTPMPFRLILFTTLLTGTVSVLWGADANDLKSTYDKFEFNIPMRDGVKLFTIVYAPKDQSEKYPILMTRTPYGVAPYDVHTFPENIGPSRKFETDKFIFVMQDVRGRFESEGDFVDVPILKDKLNGPKDTDETTDAYDTIDWLLKNVPDNNGKVGIYGISYDGFYTSCALVRSHPALAVASPQAPMADVYLGDDAYHNGALFLVANFSFYTSFNKQKNPTLPEKEPEFEYGTKDGYKFYLEMGPLANSDKQYLLFKNAYWTDVYVHTTYDKFWQPRDILPHLTGVKPAVMVVGGWYDAEDLSGTLKTFHAIEKNSPGVDLHLVMGPWFHGGWRKTDGDKLGDISFSAPTAVFYRDQVELPFFRRYLKGATDSLAKAFVFETGKNVWQSFPAWPPPNATASRLYLHAKTTLTFRAPVEPDASDSYDSDPNNPVPYYATPTLEMERDYMDADQRFLAGRKDVLTYVTEPLADDLTIAGPISPNLAVSTTGTDSDFDVKLIDVFPDDALGKLSGYRQLVRGEPFRGKFRNGFEEPVPFKPGVVQKIHFSMPDVYHCFLKGHRIMVQVQSSWFPLTDRSPQTFIDIPNATPQQFVTATERIFRSRQNPSYVEVNVVK